MPKETTHHGKMWKHVPSNPDSTEYPAVTGYSVPFEPGDTLKEGETLREEPSFEINWSKEFGHVQVSIDFTREQWLECAKSLEEDPDITKKAIYTDTWTRKEINDTIRVLRRARDQAFGADE